MHPTLLRLGPVDIQSYGAMVALGILVATAVAAALGRRRGVGFDFVLDAVFWSVLAGIAGARFLYMLVTWRETVRDPLGSLLSGGGGVFLGGLAAGGAAFVGVCRRHRIQVTSAADAFAPALAISHALGRVGCFLSGCCYGCLAGNGAAWCAVRFPRIPGQGPPEGSPAFLDHLARGLVGPTDNASLPVVPVQLVEAGLNVLLFGILVGIALKSRRAGTTTLAYLCGYAAIRFTVEFARGDEDRGIFFGLALSQWISLAMAAAAAAWMWRRRATGGRGPSESAP